MFHLFYLFDTIRACIASDIHNQHIKDWKRDDEKFIETEATRQVEQRLRDDNCVLVVGRSGNGKSSIIRHLALKVCDDNKYQIIPTVMDPSDIHLFYNLKKKQLFVIDDVCGKEKNINAQSVDVWSNQIDDILRLLKTASVFKDKHKSAINVKLLFAVGIDIYNDSIFNGLDSLRSYVCDISNWPLNDKEKLAMIRNYISSESDSKLTQKLKSDKAYFPLLCKIAEGKTAEQIIRLFSNLNDFIKQDILALKDTNNLHFCIITLCALLNDKFKEKTLNNDFDSSDEREAFENICTEFNLGTQQESAKSKIKEQLENLEGTYVTKTEDYYRFIHTKVYRIAVLVCGQTFVHNFITSIRSSFIAEKFCFISVKTDGNKNFIVIDGEDAEKRYFDRLMIDLKQGVTYSTFHNSQLKYELYRKKFIWYSRMRKQKVIELLKHFKSKKDTQNTNIDNNEYEDYIDFKKQYHFSSHNMRKPLIESAWEDNADIVQMLLDFDCDINEVDRFGRTALFVACRLGKEDIVKVLLDNNADHSLCDNNGQSPLFVASRDGYDNIVEVLLQQNADVNQYDIKGNTPLLVASSESHLGTIKILSRKMTDFSKCNKQGQSPIFVASMKGREHIVKYFLSFLSENISQPDIEGRSPLFIACREGYLDVVKLLLSNHAHVSQSDWNIRSPLFIASAEGYHDIVNVLIQNNAEINQRDEEGMTPLFIACDKGRTETAKILIESGADLNQIDLKKRTPLYAACRRGFTDIVKLLHKHDASITICNKWGGSPLFAACRQGHFDIVEYLVENDFYVSNGDLHGTTPFLVASENGFTQIVTYLINRGAEINQYNNYKKTALHLSVVGGHTDVVKVLLNAGALRTLTDNDNQTPFDLACKKSYADIVRLLRPAE
ncbi:unnamed protein product [Mytilus coruscus]|uniref:Novel STAND NTPase 3 domain-containing protein n=1 Tax=Mytilus coruscus TaxID=42192 RepID=A0A6J8BCL8_MYTCO|nr:unnamed protein product [Mytilus coruscus]